MVPVLIFLLVAGSIGGASFAFYKRNKEKEKKVLTWIKERGPDYLKKELAEIEAREAICYLIERREVLEVISSQEYLTAMKELEDRISHKKFSEIFTEQSEKMKELVVFFSDYLESNPDFKQRFLASSESSQAFKALTSFIEEDK